MGSPGTAIQKHLFIVISGSANRMHCVASKYSYEQGKLVPVSFREQIIPGSFEFAVSEIVDDVVDLSPLLGKKDVKLPQALGEVSPGAE